MRWLRLFVERIAGKKPPAQPDRSAAAAVIGPRRRSGIRYAYETRLTAKCNSWPKFLHLFTGNVSEGGLFVPTDQAAAVGERVEVALTLPDGTAFPFTGAVVNVISAEQAARFGRRPGLGIKLDPLHREARARFAQVMAAARAAAPVPAETTDGSPPPPAVAATVTPAPAPAPPVPPPAAPLGRATQALAAVTSDVTPIVGIDLGTTYTSVAAVVGRKVVILPWTDGSKSIPSVVSFPSKTERIVGAEARARIASDPAHTVVSPKRLLGRKFEERECQTFLAQAPYRALAGPDGSVVIEIWGQQYAVTQLCAAFLAEAKRVASRHLGAEVTRAVVTVPVSFDEERTKVLKRAGQLAQLDIVALIDEPSAAALANRFDPGFGGTVGVYDFGGGTFDFSVVDVSKGDFQVMATAGDTWLGGDDFDQVLAEAAANQFWRAYKVDLRKQAVEWQKLLFACERAKRALSVGEMTAIHVPGILRSVEGLIDLNISVDRPTFERACAAVIQRSLTTCDEALGLLEMKPSELSTIYLSGGTTYVPAVRQALARHFTVPVRTGVPPEHAVCLGAAIHAAQLQFNRTPTLAARDDSG